MLEYIQARLPEMPVSKKEVADVEMTDSKSTYADSEMVQLREQLSHERMKVRQLELQV